MTRATEFSELKSSLPFFRFLYKKEDKQNEIERMIAGRNVYTEVAFIISVLLSFHYWPYRFDTLHGVLAFVLWIFILTSLLTLAVINTKTMLLPNFLLKPLAALVVAYQIVLAVGLKESSVITTAIYGGLLMGGLLYLLFQVTKGRWIGGGDVKLGFVAGLLLGWKYGLLCLGLMTVLAILSFFTEYIAGKLSKSGHFSHIPTGTLWAVAIITCMLLSH